MTRRPLRDRRAELRGRLLLLLAEYGAEDRCCEAVVVALRAAWRLQARHARGGPDHSCAGERQHLVEAIGSLGWAVTEGGGTVNEDPTGPQEGPRS